VEGEPTNAAADLYRTYTARLNTEPPAELFAEIMTDDFVRSDRRTLIALPTANRDEFTEQALIWFQMGDGPPIFEFREVLGVAGERLVLCAVWIGYKSGQGVDMLQIIVFDEKVELMEQLVSFDIDDVDDALAELDRLHVDIQGSTA
jgi:hypothetical protein